MKGKLVLYPNSILRRKCRPVKDSKKVLKAIGDLKEALKKTEMSAGLAAPQLDYDWRVFGVKGGGGVRIFVNPKIILGKGKKEYLLLESVDGEKDDFLEGCLSFPKLFGTVKRWREVKVEYEVVGSGGDLLKRQVVLLGFEAVVFQHELDHLNGVLFVDHIKKEEGKLYRQEKGKMVEIKVDEILGN